MTLVAIIEFVDLYCKVLNFKETCREFSISSGELPVILSEENFEVFRGNIELLFSFLVG